MHRLQALDKSGRAAALLLRVLKRAKSPESTWKNYLKIGGSTASTSVFLRVFAAFSAL